MAFNWRPLWRYVRGLAAPLLLWGLFLATLSQLLPSWMRGDESYDEKALREWIEEARPFRDSLPEMVSDYLDRVAKARESDPENGTDKDLRLKLKAEQIEEHLNTLGTPVTKMYAGQLPLFPVIYRMEVKFDESRNLPPITWDSELPRNPTQFRQLEGLRLHPDATVTVQYQ